MADERSSRGAGSSGKDHMDRNHRPHRTSSDARLSQAESGRQRFTGSRYATSVVSTVASPCDTFCGICAMIGRKGFGMSRGCGKCGRCGTLTPILTALQT